jgi:hypothetical protein
MPVTTAIVTANLETLSGATPRLGRLWFKLNRPDWNLDGDIFAPEYVEAIADASGAISIALQVTTVLEAGASYSAILKYQEPIDGKAREYTIGTFMLPPGGPYQLTDLLAVPFIEPVPADVLALCQAYATSAGGSATNAASSAAVAVLALEDAIEQRLLAQAASGVAVTARDAATVNANVYIDIATGRAAVADGSQFMVVTGSEIIRYRRDGSSTQTEMARYPTSAVAGVLPLFTPYTSMQLYTPDTVAALPAGAKAPANYNTGGTWGTTLAYFGTTGIITGLTIGQTYTVNILGAPASVKLSRAQGGFFWTPSNVFSSQALHNGGTMNFATGDRSATFTAVTDRVSFNFVRSPTSAAMADVFTSVLGAMMVNEGTTAPPYEPQTPVKPFTPGPDFFPASKLSDDVIVQHDGTGYFYARTSWDATYDKVQRFRFGMEASTTANNLWDHHGERLIPTATPTNGTKTVFDASTLITRIGQDEGPPFRLNDMWLAGGHGPLCRQLTITGHGFVTADLGSKWTDGVRNRILAQIVDANTVRFIAENTGTTTNWTISTAAVSGATLTWVSGGVATGTKTVAADILGQAYPFIRNRVGAVTLDGQDISAPGTYGGKCLRFSERYDIPNLARALDYIVANTTSGTNSLIHASIGSQVNFSMAHTLDWTGIVRTVWSPIDVETYTNGQYGGAQTVRPETPAGGSLFAYVPKAKAFSGWDFAAGQNITAWASTASFTPAASYVNLADPPDIMAFVAKDSGGVAQWGHFYALDDGVGQGKSAYRDDLGTGLLFTASKKAYIIAGGVGSPAPVAGMVHETVNYVGTFPPGANPAMTWAVTYPKSGKHALSMRAPGAMTSQWVAVDPRLIGLPVALTASGGVATLLTDVVQDQGILMTFSGVGAAEVLIG